MPAHSRPKDGVASLAYVAGIHALVTKQGVDGRDKPGHDDDDSVRAERFRRAYSPTESRNSPIVRA
jgi:hypothetical protein